MNVQSIGIKEVGYIVIALSVVLLILMISITDQLNQSLHSECTCEGGVCPMTSNFPIQSYIGFTISIIILAFGAFLVYKSRQLSKVKRHEEKKQKEEVSSLKPEEKRVFEMLDGENNIIFQSELIEKTGFSKVKVSRIIDRLESRGLVERRRRGMTNVIVRKGA